jgi:hypothetical protein
MEFQKGSNVTEKNVKFEDNDADELSDIQESESE